MQRFDYIIVGGGTAGCVLASRLSERSSLRVLLLEAGQDFRPGAEPSDILSTLPQSYDNPHYRWPGLSGYYLTPASSPRRPLLQARVIGGGSSIMGMMALRGLSDDYNGWASNGAVGWSWEDVLPYFRKLETDLDFSGEMHGNDGPTHIRRSRIMEWPLVGKAASGYAKRTGLAAIDDMNTDFRDGIGPTPIFSTPTHRSSSAISYLTADVRKRSNLIVLGRAIVSTILFDGRLVTGVTVDVDGKPEQFFCRQLIISAGGLLSPVLLMRNGIGPVDLLKSNGIEIRESLEGVGANLQNHASLQIAAPFFPSARERASSRNEEIANNGILMRLSADTGTPGDLMVGIGSRLGRHAMATRLASFALLLMAPQSRGSVVLNSDDPQGFTVTYNLAGAPGDVDRLVTGYQFLHQLLHSPEMNRVVRWPTLITRWDRVFKLNAPTAWNAARMRAAAWLMDLAPALGAVAFGSIGQSLKRGAISRNAIAEQVRDAIIAAGHHSGTCRMGNPLEKSTVVDSGGRVIGFGGLRVVDASIMPTIPRANTNLPVLMIAEKISDHALANDRDA